MRGHIQERGPGKFRVVIYRGMENGKRKYDYYPVNGTRRDAEKLLTKLLSAKDQGAYVKPVKETVGGFLERWLADVEPTVSRRTYERYAEICRLHLIPHLGKVRLDKLQPADIQSYYTKAQKSGRHDGRGGLSPQTVLHHHRVLHEALESAVMQDILARNPANRVKPPKVPRKQTKALNAQQTTLLLEAAKDTPLYIPVLLAATAGLRRGEVLALRWDDVDLAAGVLTVRQALEKSNVTGELAFKAPKTENFRTVTLPPMTAEALRQHRLEQIKRMRLLGTEYQDYGLVCAEDDGRPIDPDWLTWNFRTWVRRVPGVPAVRYHDLRHTYATLLLHMGVPVRNVSELLGHSTPTLTLKVYGHVIPSAQQEAARKLHEALEQAATPQTTEERDQSETPLPN